MAEEQEQRGQPGSGAPPEARALDLPESVLAVLPSDPFEQLDVARKITSIALATRISKLEDEAAGLRLAVADRDDVIEDLRAQLESLDSSLADVSGQLARGQEEKENLLSENASLSSTIMKLSRDVSKLEGFKKTLMQSLQEEDESPQVGAHRMARVQITKRSSFSSGSLMAEDDTANPPPKSPATSESVQAITDDGDSNYVDGSRYSTFPGLQLPSHSGTTRLTPPDSPPRLATGFTPKQLSKPLSPRRHSISVTTTRNMFDERPGILSSVPPSHHNSMSSPFDTGTQPGRTRVDGQEFFRQVRSRLSYEQFSAFLSNVKELNSHKQTREATLRKADEIFGPDNKDLYTIFEGLIKRNLH
ncbi:Uncharacterized protein AXF42_Ash006509 [Apostasia shenzhenica]|uniref:At4g15545-like C-terminal domain-containing protein n=1 Tax=Apostasia shenzhenica TaxID=1088818 RepID=A0A2I0AZB3_9ASPA|nr:Uncharacterized protein AXF42_Ash006509 [Apostasia shenzhenica]